MGNKRGSGTKLHSATHGRRRWFVRWAITSFLLLLLVSFLYRLYVVEFDLSKVLVFDNPKRTIELLFTVTLAVLSSFLAAFLFAVLEDSREANVLESIYENAPPEFFRDFLNSLAHYQGKIRYDHVVEVVLRPHRDHDDFLLC